MKKEIATHFSFLIFFFIFITIFKGWLSLEYIPFWAGGIIGTLLIDLDHLIYVYFLRPKDEISMKASELLSKRKVKETLRMLASTRYERSTLVFHTIYFQAIMLVFTLLVVTSTASILGRGIVLAASLHILIDQVIDYIEIGSIQTWFRDIPVTLEKKQSFWFLVIVTAILFFLGFYF